MDETAGQIESHIESTREDLQSNIRELEQKVKSATDWRQYFQKHTGVMIAAAFGGGVLLSTMAKRTRTSDGSSSQPATRLASAAHAAPRSEVLNTLDNIKTALVGVAATKLKGMVGDIVPGFKEQLERSDSTKARPDVRPAERMAS